MNVYDYTVNLSYACMLRCCDRAASDATELNHDGMIKLGDVHY